MKKVSLIAYNLSKANPGQKTAIQRALNGYIDYSNNQAYTYKRRGLVEQSLVRASIKEFFWWKQGTKIKL